MSPRTDLYHDIGQLIWAGFEGTEATPEVLDLVKDGRIGAAIVFKRNLALSRDADGAEVADLEALRELLRSLHRGISSGEPPLWIAVDQEGGRVQRVRAPARVWPPMLSYAGAAEAEVEAVGEALGRELAELGFDVDFAPVLDVHTNPANPIIGDRAFGTEPEPAASRALAFARGLARAGVVACGKHFPGHGDTSTDSHLELPRLDHDLDRLRRVELEPFRRAIVEGIPMIMTAHVVFAALDDRVPATLSPRVINGLLREELGFRGIVVSDDLDMRAIADHFGVGEAAVAAIRAGCDSVLVCNQLDNREVVFEALVQAAEAETNFRDRIGEAADRIRDAKRARA